MYPKEGQKAVNGDRGRSPLFQSFEEEGSPVPVHRRPLEGATNLCPRSLASVRKTKKRLLRSASIR